MPPSWWQPAHVSRTIGATSRAKLGVAVVAAEEEPPPSTSAEQAIAASDAAKTSATRRPRLLIVEAYAQAHNACVESPGALPSAVVGAPERA